MLWAVATHSAPAALGGEPAGTIHFRFKADRIASRAMMAEPRKGSAKTRAKAGQDSRCLAPIQAHTVFASQSFAGAFIGGLEPVWMAFPFRTAGERRMVS